MHISKYKQLQRTLDVSSKNVSILTETLSAGMVLVAISHWSPKMLLVCILLMLYLL